MKLYLHIGTEKTGSSYLQYLLYINREILQKQYGIFVPSNKMQDKRMRKGMISAGNGVVLKEYLKEKKHNDIEKYLEGLVTDAETAGCKSIVLSNENIFEYLDEENISTIHSLAEHYNLECSFLLVLREPSSHIISLYKHRNKNGDYKSLKDWVWNHYDTHKKIDACINIFKQFSLHKNITISKFDGVAHNHLSNAFFIKWLNINLKSLNINGQKVNASLNLAEIKLLNSIADKRGFLKTEINKELSKIDNSRKAEVPKTIDNICKSEALQYIIENYSWFRIYIEAYFGEDHDKYNFYSDELAVLNEFEKTNEAPNIVLSKYQIRAIGRAMNRVALPYNILRSSFRKILSIFPQYIRDIYKYKRI